MMTQQMKGSLKSARNNVFITIGKEKTCKKKHATNRIHQAIRAINKLNGILWSKNIRKNTIILSKYLYEEEKQHKAIKMVFQRR